jgi:hypothetical protein
MAITTLAVTSIGASGAELTYTAANADGMYVACEDTNPTFLKVKNGGSSSINVTCDAITKCSQGYEHDMLVAVVAGKEEEIKIDSRFINRTTGNAEIYFSAVTDVTVCATKKG